MSLWETQTSRWEIVNLKMKVVNLILHFNSQRVMKTNLHTFKSIKLMVGIGIASAASIFQTPLNAQTNINGSIKIHSQAVWSDFSQNLKIGDSAQVNVEGEMQTASQNIHFSPLSIMDGNGQLILQTPSSFTIGGNPLSWDETVIDAGGVTLNLDLVLANENGIYLSDFDNLNANLILNKQLYFEKDGAHLTLNNHQLVLGEDSQVFSASNNRYIVTNADGNVKKLDVNTAFTFPVGIGANNGYSPVEVEPVYTTDVAVKVLTLEQAEIKGLHMPTELGVNQSWEIVTDAPQALLSIQHNDYHQQSEFDNVLGFISQYIGYAPNEFGGFTSNNEWDNPGLPSPIVNQSDNNSSFTHQRIVNTAACTQFTKVSSLQQAFYIDLLMFDAHLNDLNEVDIDWETVINSHVDYFIVERSTDGEVFQEIDRVNEVDYHLSRFTYHNSDDLAGINSDVVYYRLVRIDTNGNEDYSNVKKVMIYTDEMVRLYPNPVTSCEVVHIHSNQDIKSIYVYNSNGKLVKEYQLDKHMNQTFVPEVSSGVYVVKFETFTGTIETKKVMIY